MADTEAQRQYEYEAKVDRLGIRIFGQPKTLNDIDLVLITILMDIDQELGDLGLSEQMAMKALVELSTFSPTQARQWASEWKVKLGA